MNDHLDTMDGAEPAPESAIAAVEDARPASPIASNREKVRIMITVVEHQANELQTTPFLIRTFIKIGGFHHISLFEEGKLPVSDEQQIYTWCGCASDAL